MSADSEEESDDIPITNTIPGSVATKMKLKRKQSEKQETMKGKLKATSMKTSDARKKQASVATDNSNVKWNDQDIQSPNQKRKVDGKKIPKDVPDATLDYVSFHYEKSVAKWEFVCQIRISRERELHKDALKCKEVMDLISLLDLLKL